MRMSEKAPCQPLPGCSFSSSPTAIICSNTSSKKCPETAHRIRMTCPRSGPALPSPPSLQDTFHILFGVPLTRQTVSWSECSFSLCPSPPGHSPRPGAQHTQVKPTGEKAINSALAPKWVWDRGRRGGANGPAWPRGRGRALRAKGSTGGMGEGHSSLRGTEQAEGVEAAQGPGVCDPEEVLSLLPPPPCLQLGSRHNHPSPAQSPGSLWSD